MNHPEGRLDVRKTCRLYVGGAFSRSESGRSYEVTDHRHRALADAAHASPKDARDAVAAARKAFPDWSTRTPYHRGQVLYQAAEALAGRRGQLADEVSAAEGLSRRRAGHVVDLSVDRMVWYAGWADKLAQVVGGANPVAGPYLNVSMPHPVGVVAVLAPQGSSLLGLVSVVAPVVVTGNTCVVASSTPRPIPAFTFSEVLATSDVPGGVANVLTGPLEETAPTLASHLAVDAIDLAGAAGHPERARLLEEAAAGNLKRVLRASSEEPDWSLEPDLGRMTAFLETRTLWHPIGM